MKKYFSMFFVVFIFTAMRVNGSGAMSFNGQDGRDSTARNQTVPEWMDEVVRGKTTDGLAYYTECPQDVLQNNIKIVQSVAQKILLEQLNEINNITKDLWVDAQGRPVQITDINDAETIVNAYVALEDLGDGVNYTFFSMDNSFNGKVGTVTRKIYRKGEKGFVLTSPKTGKKFLLGSAYCANPTPIDHMALGGGGKMGGGFEQFDTSVTASGVTINLSINNSSSVTNSGNNTNTVTGGGGGGGSDGPPGFSQEETGINRASSGSNSGGQRSGGNASASDDTPGSTDGGATATSESKSFTLVLAPRVSISGGGARPTPPIYGGGYRPVYRPRYPHHPTPPYTGGQGYDYGGVNATGQGGYGGYGRDFEAVD